MSQKQYQILVIEDETVDRHLIQRAVSLSQQPVTLQFLSQGQELSQWLSELSKDSSVLPTLILLNLNSPMQSGLEILKQLRQDKLLQLTPVIVFSASRASADILKSYQMGCNSYVCKPAEWPDFCRVIAAIIDFWLGFVKLPQEDRL